MYQLNIPFNKNPKDDIEDIKKELKQLTIGISDEELESEVKNLEEYVEKLYLSFERNSEKGFLDVQLQNLYMLNMVNLIH